MMLKNCLERLEETLDLETSALKNRDLACLEEFNRRKSQSLLEISRVARFNDSVQPIDELAIRLVSVQEKLQVNREALYQHLRAVQEVASTISRAIQSAESDGTYSASIRRFGACP